MTQTADVSSTTAPLEIVPYGPTMAAEVRGVDFSRPVDEPKIRALHAALMEHKVLFFRNAEMTPEQQAAFGRQFGELTIHPVVPHLDHLPEVIVLDNHKDDHLPPRERHEKLAEMDEELPNPTHPVASAHPITGRSRTGTSAASRDNGYYCSSVASRARTFVR